MQVPISLKALFIIESFESLICRWKLWKLDFSIQAQKARFVVQSFQKLFFAIVT